MNKEQELAKDSLLKMKSENLKDEIVRFSFKLSEENVKKNKMFKVPIAVVGEWVHKAYGDVKFAIQDFKDIINNFTANVTGYEPPLFLGHPKDDVTVEGAPAVGFLSRLFIEAETLFGEFEAVDEKVYGEVKDGKYRYSSAEIVRGAQSKKTGDSIGTLLVGCALTNRPFLTDMPRVATYSDFITVTNTNSSREIPSFYIQQKETKVNDMPEVNTDLNTAADNGTTLLSEQAAALATKKAEDDQAKYAAEFLRFAEKVHDYESGLQKAQEELARMRREKKVETVKSLTLSQAVKDEFVQLILGGFFEEEQEDRLMSSLHKMSESNNATLLEQQGSSDTTEQYSEGGVGSGDKLSNPYASIIERNRRARHS